MRKAFAGVVLGMALVADPAAAQTAISRVPVVQPSAGDRVRVHHGAEGSRVVQGTWVAQDPHGIRLLKSSKDTVQVALDRLVGLERSTGTKRHTGVGAVVGTLVGLLVGIAVAPEEDPMAPSWGFSESEASAIGGMVIGGLAGAVIGATIKTDRWEWVPLRPQ